MEEPEIPFEQVDEMKHHAAHGGDKWVGMAALTAAIIAALAAVTAMLSGHHANEAMLEQLHASDQWAFYQAKSIKASILQAKSDLLTAEGKTPSEKDTEKQAEYKKEQEEISKEAKESEEESRHHLKAHVILSRGVTLFQVAIAIVAIAVLTKRKAFWLIGVMFGLAGAAFLVQGLL